MASESGHPAPAHQGSGQAADPVQVIDTVPLPICGYTRSHRDRCLKPEADYG
jgi:hypothetical protein